MTTGESRINLNKNIASSLKLLGRAIMIQISSKAKYEIISMAIIKKYLCTNMQKIVNKNN